MNSKEVEKLPDFTAHPPWELVKSVLIPLLKQEITPTQAIEKLISKKIYVSLIYDRDFDGYIVTPEKICSIYEGKKGSVDVAFYFFSRKEYFKPSIKEALAFYMWPKEDYEDGEIFISKEFSFYTKQV